MAMGAVVRRHFSIVTSIVLLMCIEYAHFQDTSNNKFSCQGRPSGYYADVQSGCQIYHMCDTLGRQFSYSCPNTTLFQQRMLVCDHWYMVNCSKSEIDYDANLLIGQREKPFVEDDDEHPYHRTPRPDLLAHPSASEYNIVYRSGRAQYPNHKNLVGVDTESTDQPAYFLPSHWSTDYRKTPASTTTQRAVTTNQKGQKTKKPYFISKEPTAASSTTTISSASTVHVNFKSNFKATTPVYPNVAPTEIPLEEEDFSQNQPKLILVAPSSSRDANKEQKKDENKVQVNFASSFKATTPVYPQFVTPEEPLAEEELPAVPNNLPYGLSSIVEPPKQINEHLSGLNIQKQNKQDEEEEEEEVVVNFASDFKATTPVYPKFVDSEEPLAIQEEAVDPNQPSLSTVIQPPRGYHQNSRNTLLQPSIYYQPPIRSSSSESSEGSDGHNEIQVHVESRNPGPRSSTRSNSKEETTKYILSNLNWKELRRALLIPEYDFPLDASAVRPNYDQGPSSFQVNPFTYELRQRKSAS